jgi:hypothetical protein
MGTPGLKVEEKEDLLIVNADVISFIRSHYDYKLLSKLLPLQISLV